MHLCLDIQSFSAEFQGVYMGSGVCLAPGFSQSCHLDACACRCLLPRMRPGRQAGYFEAALDVPGRAVPCCVVPVSCVTTTAVLSMLLHLAGFGHAHVCDAYVGCGRRLLNCPPHSSGTFDVVCASSCCCLAWEGGPRGHSWRRCVSVMWQEGFGTAACSLETLACCILRVQGWALGAQNPPIPWNPISLQGGWCLHAACASMRERAMTLRAGI
jgi:hypothetical protein